MVQLLQLRTEKGWTQKQMSQQLGFSLRTIARIEAKERAGEKYPIEARNIFRLVTAVNKTFKQSYTAKDLEGVELAPPRPGRPKKEENHET